MDGTVGKNSLPAGRQETLWQRARIIRKIRGFFIDQGYLEVETPHRIPAPAPESHIDPVPSGSWFLQASPEICMKRLLASGYGKMFQICRCWRSGERGSLHLPEFTLLEWYRAGCDYRSLMTECETMIRTVAAAANPEEGTVAGGVGGPALSHRVEELTFRGREVDLACPWERISVEEAFRAYTPLSMRQALEQDLFDETMVNEIEPNLGLRKPTFLFDYPAERKTLARLKPGNPDLAERFELYIGGLELANAFSELTDPGEQKERFIQENEIRRSRGKPASPLPEKFLLALENMPPSAGIAMGVDRLVMVLANASSIDEVVAFTPEEL
jgi:lysyl-tRNA synthetase class 2